MAWRIRIFFLRLIDYLLHLHIRVFRLLKWMFGMYPLRGKHKFYRWIAGLILLLLDLMPVSFLIECVLDLIKVKSRPLSSDEKIIAADIFKESLPLNLIGMNPASIKARKKIVTAYVSFHTINFDTSLSPAVFIHELVHIWQFRKYGSVYISEALWAQKWGGGYNYGGLDALRKYHDLEGLKAFNFEQQAEIVEDYYRWKNNLSLRWSKYDGDTGVLLASFTRELMGAGSYG